MLRLACFLLAAGSTFAAITGMEVIERKDVGKDYERIRAKARFAVDPKLPQNQRIIDLDAAPKNEDGLVEFETDIEILKPRDPKTGNGTLLLDIVNRGNQTLGMFTEAFLMEKRFTALWVGWQWDMARKPGLIRLYPAVAKGLTGLVRAELTIDAPTTQMNLGDRDHLAYPVADPSDPKLTLTVRDSPLGKRTPIARDKWKFNADATGIEMASGFQSGKTYELVYTAKDPAVAGLGPAAVRDFVSFLKYGGPGHFLLADQRQHIKRAIGYGTSQSGRFLRTYLYQGFNEDEKGRKVFDGVWANVAGAGRGSFNHRFAQASRDGHPTMNFFYPTDIYPFTDDLLLANVKQPAKVFYTNGSYEYWGRAASLIHTSTDGKQDAPLNADTRIYFIAGSQHGPQSFPPNKPGNVRYLRNSVDYRPIYRALLIAMHEWLKDGTAPPDSSYPRISQGQLVSRTTLKFPKNAGGDPPVRVHTGYQVDYGPEFATKGIVSKEPPTVGAPFTALVPQVDDDGNEIAGVKMPQVAAPLATYTGWNLRDPKIGLPQETYNMVGSTLPFNKAKITEKYGTKEKYLEKARAAADDLISRRLLLAEEKPKLLEDAAKQWDWFMSR